jgi:hypothetical protein
MIIRIIILFAILFQCGYRSEHEKCDAIINSYPKDYDPFESFGIRGFAPSYRPEKIDDERMLFIAANVYKVALNEKWIDENGVYNRNNNYVIKTENVHDRYYWIYNSRENDGFIILTTLGNKSEIKYIGKGNERSWVYVPGDGSGEITLQLTGL